MAFVLPAQAQSDSTAATISNHTIFAARLHYGNIYIHTKGVSNVTGANPTAFEVEYSKRRSSDSLYQLYHAYPRSGVAAGYLSFGTPILGHGYTLSYFAEPAYRINRHLYFLLRGGIGAAYLTRPYHAITHPQNRSYTLHLNPYMQLGGGLALLLNRHLTLAATTNFQHISNGGYKEPNRGVNWYTGTLGLLYQPDGKPLPHYHHKPGPRPKLRPAFIETGLFAVGGQGYSSYLKARRHYVAGLFAQYTKPIGRLSAFTAGAEVYNSRIVETVPTEQNSKASPWFAGIHAGHAFVFNRVVLRQQLGVYLLNQTTYFKSPYLRFGIDYAFSKHLAAGAALKSHTDNADFVDLRLMYRW